MKRLRTILGLALIIVAVASFVFWEVKGRESLMLDTVIVASEKIQAGTVITRDLLSKTGVAPENRVHKSVDFNELHSILGLVTSQNIVKNGQISLEYLIENDFYLRKNQSVYVLESDWIMMRSSSIRRGDWIDIYDGLSKSKIGTYRVAFVKDSNEIEVTDGDGFKEPNVLNRVKSSSVVDHVEIIADISEYKGILNVVTDGETKLILVQKGVAL